LALDVRHVKRAAPRRPPSVDELRAQLAPEQLAQMEARAALAVDEAAARVTREQTVGRLHGLFGAPTGRAR
jgi:hypothetical protein